MELAVYDFGGAAGAPAVLFAHATGFHARCWLPVVAELGPGFRCYAFDERGHGDSTSPPNGDFDWHRHADDALAVVDALGLVQPFGVGHSCGGALLLLAEMFRPGTFRALYCYEPVVLPIEPTPVRGAGAVAENALAAGARRRREVFPSFDAARAHLASKPPMSLFRADALDAYVEYGFEPVSGGEGGGGAGEGGRDSGGGVRGGEGGGGGKGGVHGGGGLRGAGGVRLKCRGEDEARTYENAVFHGAYTRLAEVGCPVTVGYGEHTTAFPRAVLEPSVERLPAGRLEELPGLTHFGPQEDPALVADAIARAFSGALSA